MIDKVEELKYTKEELIIFKEGIFGFEEYTSFLPLPVEDESGNIISITSVEDENLSFLLINPFSLNINYKPKLSKDDFKKLETSSEEDLSFYAICVLADKPENITINLKCPIVVNAINRKAIQAVLQTEEYSLRHSFKSLAKGE